MTILYILGRTLQLQSYPIAKVELMEQLRNICKCMQVYEL